MNRIYGNVKKIIMIIIKIYTSILFVNMMMVIGWLLNLPRPPLYLSKPRNLTLSPNNCRNSSNNNEFSLLSKICSSVN